MAKFGNDLLRVTPASASEFYVEGVVDHTTDRNSRVNQADTGKPYGAEPSIGFQAPTMRFTTEDLGTLITNMSAINGLCYATGGTPGLVMYQPRHDRCAANGRGAGSTNMTTTSALGHLLIDSIRGSAGANAQATLMAHPLSSDGETDPLATVFNGALPGVTIAETAWKIGGLVLDDTWIEEVVDLSISFNHQFTKPIHADFTYVKEFDWQKASPVLTITIDNPEAVLDSGEYALPAVGNRINSGSSYIQFRRADNATTGGAEAPGNSSHLRCGINGMVHSTTPFSGSGAGTGTLTLEIITNENATGVPLVWLTGQTMVQSQAQASP